MRTLLRVPGARFRRRSGLFAATAAMVVAAATAVPGPAPAQTNDGRIGELQGEIGEASAAEAAALRELAAAQARRREADTALAGVNARIGEAQARLDSAQVRLEEAAGRFLALSARLDELERARGDAQDTLERTAASLYRHGGADATDRGSYLLDDVPTHERIAGGEYLERASDAWRREMRRVTILRDDTAVARDALEEERRAADAIRVQAEQDRASLEPLRVEQAAARDRLATDEAAERQVVESIRARKAEFTAELTSLQAASSSVAGLLRGRPSAPGTAPSSLRRPVAGAISSPFGPRVHPIFGDTRVHTGMDFSAASGTPIWAAGNGIVVSAAVHGGYGNAVIIDHGGGLATLYAHQSRMAVSAGQQVAAGAVIGYVGSTGASTGPHLHFETRVDGTPVDPARYL